MIDSFTGQYEWLSNFSYHGFHINGVLFKTNEHWYQASKTLDRQEQEEVISCPTPRLAKKWGQKITLREDWDEVKNVIMYIGLKNKFTQNAYLVTYLLDTGTQELVEGNFWNDLYWGVCKGKGQNHLGKLLMKLREEFRTAETSKVFF